MHTHIPTSRVSLPAASVNVAEPSIPEPLRLAIDAAIHTPAHGDSKPLPNNRTAKVLLFYRVRLCVLLLFE